MKCSTIKSAFHGNVSENTFDFFAFQSSAEGLPAIPEGGEEQVRFGLTKQRWTHICGKDGKLRRDTMMELRIQLVPTGEIILPPGKNGENYCNNCKVRSHSVVSTFDSEGFEAEMWGDTAEVTGVDSHRDENQ